MEFLQIFAKNVISYLCDMFSVLRTDSWGKLTLLIRSKDEQSIRDLCRSSSMLKVEPEVAAVEADRR